MCACAKGADSGRRDFRSHAELSAGVRLDPFFPEDRVPKRLTSLSSSSSSPKKQEHESSEMEGGKKFGRRGIIKKL